MRRTALALVPLLLALLSCGGSSSGSPGASQGDSGSPVGPGGSGGPGGPGGPGATADGSTGGGTSDSAPVVAPASDAAGVVRKLGRDPTFLVGLGSDMDGATALGAPLDIYYHYLVRSGGDSWVTWNSPPGDFVNIVCKLAADAKAVPMFTFYEMAGLGDGNVAIIDDAAAMGSFWADVDVLVQQLARADVPALVQFEPDFWGYLQQKSADPTAMSAKVKIAASCNDLPDTAAGMSRCILRKMRGAPKALVGLHASEWAAWNNGTPDPVALGNFLLALGVDQADFVTVETSDRDAGCFEVNGPECTGRQGPFYWDEANAKSPTFHEHLAWAKAVHDTTKRPLLWWQMPLGVPSDTAGGSPGHYRDNRVHYVTTHAQEFVDAGGFGAVFGAGANGQTKVSTDGGQFKNAVTAYQSSRVRLP